MNNIDDILYELDKMLVSEGDKNAMADEAMKKADELRAKAELAKQEALLNQKKIEEARKRVEEARIAMEGINVDANHVNRSADVDNDTTRENSDSTMYAAYGAPKYEVVETKNTKKNRTGLAFVSGVLVTALLATGAWVLCKECKKGRVLLPAAYVDANKSGKRGNCKDGEYIVIPCDEAAKAGVIDAKTGVIDAEIGETDIKTDIYDAGDCTKYIYNYDQNVVTVTTGVDAEAARAGVESSQELFTTTDTTSQFVDVPGTERVIVNPVQEPEIDINGEYVELTTERFEDLTSALIKKYESMGLQVSREKIIKYVMVRNIDKLKQDNPELVKSIIGTQTVEKVYTDFEDVISAITTYNWLDFDRYHDVDRLLSAADGVFDETQKAKVVEIEKRVHEIGRNYLNEETYNDLSYSLLRDMINPLSQIYGLEDGVSLGVQWIDTYLVRAKFGIKNAINLHVQVNELIKQFITFPEDTTEQFENAVATGNMAAVKILLNDCLLESSKLLVK